MKERTISRTITLSNVTVLAVNLLSNELKDLHYTFAGEFNEKIEAKYFKNLKAEVETNELKLVAIKNVEMISKLYEMPEELFIQYATVVEK